MKYLIPFLFFAISCNQQPQQQPILNALSGSISYTINDTLDVSFTTNQKFVKSSLPCDYNSMSCNDNSVVGRVISCDISTDNLMATLYTDTISICDKNQVYFLLYENGKGYSNKYWKQGTLNKCANDTYIKITSITDSTISGVFKARLISPSVSVNDTINLSNGVFTLAFSS